MPGDRPLRVLVLLASANRRGAEIEGERLARELSGAGIDASVAALSPGGDAALDVPVLGDRPLAPGTLRALRRRSRGVDVVVAYGSSTLPACALGLLGTRTPFVYRSIGDPQAWVRGGLHLRRTGCMMRRAERVVALWPDARDALVELYSIPPDRIVVIPNARSPEEYRPATAEERDAARSRLALPVDARVIAFIGSLSPEKRPGLAIAAMEHLPDATLLVVGAGPLRDDLTVQTQSVAPDQVRFLGALPLLTDVYAATDLVLSTSATEGMSGVLIEAGLSGVPVCASDVGATGWLVAQGLGGVCFPATATPADTAAAVERALTIAHPGPPRDCDWRVATTKWAAALAAVAELRVLAVLDSTGAGGAETSTALMAPLLREMGIDFQVAFFHDRRGVKQRLIDTGVPIHHVPAGRGRLVTLVRLIRLIRTLRPDVVHTAVYEADIIGRTAGWVCRVPVVSSIINDIYGPEHSAAIGRPARLRLAWAVDLITARFVAHFHAISQTVADSVGPRLHIPAEKITVIYRGRPVPDPEELVATSEIESLMRGDPPDGRFTLLAVGRQERQKGFDLLVRAIEELDDDIHAVIAGREGNATAEIRRLVADLGLQSKVHFVGERSDVPALMANADLVVVPSRWEGLGGVLVEALSLGAPCVCSDIPVFREVARSAMGAVSFVPRDEHRGIVQAVRVARRTQARRGGAAVLGASFATEFGLAETSTRYARLYLTVND